VHARRVAASAHITQDTSAAIAPTRTPVGGLSPGRMACDPTNTPRRQILAAPGAATVSLRLRGSRLNTREYETSDTGVRLRADGSPPIPREARERGLLTSDHGRPRILVRRLALSPSARASCSAPMSSRGPRRGVKQPGRSPRAMNGRRARSR
jgi:hypothetical protein